MWLVEYLNYEEEVYILSYGHVIMGSIMGIGNGCRVMGYVQRDDALGGACKGQQIGLLLHVLSLDLDLGRTSTLLSTRRKSPEKNKKKGEKEERRRERKKSEREERLLAG